MCKVKEIYVKTTLDVCIRCFVTKHRMQNQQKVPRDMKLHNYKVIKLSKNICIPERDGR